MPNIRDYPINYNVLAEDFRGKTEFTQDDARWLLDSLTTMCNAYDELLDRALDHAPTEARTDRALGIIDRHRAVVEASEPPRPGKQGGELPMEVIRDLISASRALDGDKTTDPEQRAIIDEARAWLHANQLPTEWEPGA